MLSDVYSLSVTPSPRTDLVSVGSYRTNISMTDFENTREYGAKDNVSMDIAHETQIGGIKGNMITANLLFATYFNSQTIILTQYGQTYS